MNNQVKLFDDMKQDRKILVASTLKNVVKKMFSLWKKNKFGNECFKVVSDKNYRVTLFETPNEVALYHFSDFPVRIATINRSGVVTHGKLKYYDLVVITEISNGFENTFTG